jgi:hypothetical protein
MVRQAKFDLEGLRDAGTEARARVEQWPAWKQEVARATSSGSAGGEKVTTAGDEQIVACAPRTDRR